MRMPQSPRCRQPLACGLTFALLLCARVSLHAQQSDLQSPNDYASPPTRVEVFPENPSKAPPKTEAEKKRDESDWTIKISNAPKYAAVGWSYVLNHRDDPKRLEKAWGYFHQAIACDDQYIDAFYGRGLALMFLNRLPQTLDDFNLVLSKEPHRRQVNPMRAYVRAVLARYGNEEELKAAEQDLERAVVTKPKSPFYRAAQGIIAEKRRDYPAAVAHLSWAIEHGFDSWSCQVHRAVAYEQLQDYSRAIADIEHGLKEHPSWPGPYRLLGNCHFAMGKPELALADYANALKVDPENVEVVCNRMVVAIGIGKSEIALDDFDRIVARHPDHPYALAFRGLLRWLAGKNLALVKADIDRAIKLCPQEWSFHALRAALDCKRADYTHALGDAGRCCIVLRRTEFKVDWYIESTGNGHGRIGVRVFWRPEGAEENEKKDARPADLEHRLAELGLKALWALASR